MNPSSELDFGDVLQDPQSAGGGGGESVVELIARGELDAAVSAYEATAGASRDALLQEAERAAFEVRKAIAQVLFRARDFGAAGKVFQLSGLNSEAALAFENGGEFLPAADCWSKCGELLKAGAAYERGGKLEQALDHYRRARATDRSAHCLARSHHFAEAAAQFRELKNLHAEVETLKTGLSAEPGNVEVATRLAAHLLQQGRKEQATRLLAQTAKHAPAAVASASFLSVLAQGLEAVGNTQAAAKARARMQALPPDSEPPIVMGTEEPLQGPGSDAYGFLKALPMFGALELNDMMALYRSCAQLSFKAGEHLIETGRAGRGLFVIVDGQVEVYGGPNEGSRLLNTLGVGGYVGEISLVQEGPTSARVTARTAVKALFVSREAFHQYLYSTPSAALCIYRMFTVNLAERVRVLSAAN